MKNYCSKRLLAAFCVLGIVAAIVPLGTFQRAYAQHLPECDDRVDNDRDGHTDYPEDRNCQSVFDDSEEDEFNAPVNQDLFLRLSDGLQEVEPGGHITYTIGLNTEHGHPRIVDVHFLMPPETNLISASNGGSRQGDFLVWPNVSVHPEQERQLFVEVSLHPRAEEGYLVFAEVLADGQRDSDTTRVVRPEVEHFPDEYLEIHVDDGKVYAEPTEELTYRIVVENPTTYSQEYTLHTTLHPELYFVSASGDPHKDGRKLRWPRESIAPDEVHEYFLVADIDREVQDNTVIQLRVAGDGAIYGTDSTSIHTGIIDEVFEIRVTDGIDRAAPGDIVVYEIFVNNDTSKLATEMDVNAALPTYTEFVSASEGGYWTGKNVRWEGITISPFGQRVLQVSARVRSDAPLGADLRFSAETRGHAAVDIAYVDAVSDIAGIRGVSGGAPIALQPRSPMLLRKVADRSEVRPGDTVNYTVFVRNNTDRAFQNVFVEDRMDTQYMQVLGSDFGALQGDRMTWTIPSLAPGEEWTVRYTVRIADSVPHGVSLSNVVSVSGEGIETLSLTERVLTRQMNVIRKLPPTGAPLGNIFAFGSLLLGVVPMGLQRRFV